MKLVSETETKKRRPVKRWIILALIAAGIYAAFLGPSILKPISPVVVLPGEPTGLNIAGFKITNTVMATLLSDVLLILMAIGVWRYSRSGKLAPSGLTNAFEALVEFLWNSVTEAAESKWAKRIFPIVATIFLLIFVANMVKLVPGFESIGRIQEVHEGKGYAPVSLFHIGSLNVFTIDKGQPQEASLTEQSVESEAGHETDSALCEACEIVPFLRGSATDLNFTFALAVITVVLTQVFGVWALGPGYFSKFVPVKDLVSGNPFGVINFGVGLLEIVLELAKILSFAFRLFGNIFAGALLLSVVGALTAVIVPAGLYIFEVFFGIIQAYVFFLLAVVFISGALTSHHGGHEDEHH
jgi:F-type H+-transporting ATPase subunit a